MLSIGDISNKFCNIQVSNTLFSRVFSSRIARFLKHAQLRQLLKAYTYVTEKHKTGSGSCPVAGFGFSDVVTCSSATTVLVMSKMLSNSYLKETQSANKTNVNVTTMLYSRSS
jgi:hypothetical protein